MTSGELIYVDVEDARGFVAEAATAGATTLTISSAALLPADLAEVEIDDETYAVESLTLNADENLAGTLVLATPLVADVELDQPVNPIPAATVTFGLVAVAGDSEPTRILIPQSDQDSTSLALGQRDYGQGEAVEFEALERGPELTWVEGRLERDGTFIDPETLPGTTPVQPTTSPTPTVDGFAGVVLARWVGILNDTPVMYDVHVSDSDASLPNASTLLDSVASTMTSIRLLPDETPLAYDTTYYVAIVARSGDLAADPSPWVSGQMDRTKNADLAADAIDGMTITGATFRTGSAGAREEITTAEGYRSFASSGAVQTQIKDGKLTAEAAEITGEFSTMSSSGTGFITRENVAGGGEIVFKDENVEVGAIYSGTGSMSVHGEEFLGLTVGEAYSLEATYSGILLDTANGILFETMGGVPIEFRADESDLTLAADGVIYLNAASVRSQTIADTTTGAGANVYVNSANGVLARSTSSRRYKKDIGDEDWGLKILDAQPASWVDKNAPDGRRYFGFIAEQLVDVGLEDLVDFDKEGRADAIPYGALTAPIVSALRALRDSHAELEQTVEDQARAIAALTDRLEALEARA